MTCKDVSGMLDRLMDGELTADERRELEAHGRECPECAEEIRAAFEMKALFEETLPEVDVPLAAQAKWRGAVREAAKQDRKKKWTRWIGSAAAAVVVLAGVGLALNGSLAPKQEAAQKLAVVQEAAEADGAYEADAAEVAFEANEVEYAAEAVNEADVAAGGAYEAREADFAAEAADEAPVIETDGESEALATGYDAPKAMAMPEATDETLPVEAAGAAMEAETAMEMEAAEVALEEEPAAFEDAAVGDEAMCAALAQQSPACEYAIQAMSVEVACEVIGDLAEEFEGSADVQSVEGGSANVYVELDAASAGEFLAAVAKLDDAGNPAEPPRVSGEGTVLVLLVVEPAEGE